MRAEITVIAELSGAINTANMGLAIQITEQAQSLFDQHVFDEQFTITKLQTSVKITGCENAEPPQREIAGY